MSSAPSVDELVEGLHECPSCTCAPTDPFAGLRPAYTGDEVCCPKCHHTGADTEWQPTGALLTVWGQLINQSRGCESGEPGWLLRTCGRCRYRWAEATEDGRMQA